MWLASRLEGAREQQSPESNLPPAVRDIVTGLLCIRFESGWGKVRK